MKKYLLLLSASLLLVLNGCFTVKSTTDFTYQKLEPSVYVAWLKDSSDYYLIDVRTPGEYDKAHIRNAINHSLLNFHYGKDVDSLDRNKLVFVYCHTCHRSPFAARIMKRKGFRKVYDLKGGFSQWRESE